MIGLIDSFYTEFDFLNISFGLGIGTTEIIYIDQLIYLV